MHIFEEGDRVYHRPSGLVLYCKGYGLHGIMVSDSKVASDISSHTRMWPEEDCEPYRDPAPVIEAAKRFLEYFDDDQYSKAAREMLREALDVYRGQPLEPERVPTLSEPGEPEHGSDYKWLTTDGDGTACGWDERPVMDNAGYWIPKFASPLEIDPRSSWLKPGHLWEECTTDLDDRGRRVEEWDGRAWRLVEDHSESNPNIIERRPAKADADERGKVLAEGKNGDGFQGWLESVWSNRGEQE